MAPKLATRGPRTSKGPPILKPQEPGAYEGVVNERFIDSPLPGKVKLWNIGPMGAKGPPILVNQQGQDEWKPEYYNPADIASKETNQPLQHSLLIRKIGPIPSAGPPILVRQIPGAFEGIVNERFTVLLPQQPKLLRIGPQRTPGPPILLTQWSIPARPGSAGDAAVGGVGNNVTHVAQVIGMLGGAHALTVTRIEVAGNLALAGGASPLRITKQEVAAVLGLLGGTDSFTITRSLTAGNLQLAGGVAHLTSTRIESAGLLSLLGGAHGASAGRNIAEVAAHLSLLGGTDSITVVRSHTSGHFSMLGGTHDPNPEYHLHPELVAALLSLSSGTHYIIHQAAILEWGGITAPEEKRGLTRNRNTP